MLNDKLYIHRLRDSLLMEYEAEKEEFRIQSEQMGLDRKKRRGICWYPIHIGNSYYNSLNQFVVEVFRDKEPETSDELEYTTDNVNGLFEFGKPLQFFSIKDNGSTHYMSSTAQVCFVDGNRMSVILSSQHFITELQKTENLGLQLYFDETSYRTMLSALNEVEQAKDSRLAELREIAAGHRGISKYTTRPMTFPWLNKTQEKAVNEVLCAKDVSVLHGPPGTGKTTTLVEAIHETLRRETQVLVCAQSNMAVDLISEKLTDYGISVLRIGNPSRVNDKMLSFTYERLFADHPNYAELWSIRKAIRQLRSTKNKSEHFHQKVTRLRERAAEIEIKIHTELFANAKVVATTLVGAANKLMIGQKFITLFIDEAAQALEPACWIAMRRANRVIFAGDHQQLPPTIKSYDAMKAGLGITLMERLVMNQPDCVTLLGIQYRMNETIMRFSSDWFYEGKVIADKSVQHRSILDYETPIVWVESEEYEQYVGDNHGRINKAEAEMLLLNLQGYVNKIGIERIINESIDIGIITPYRVQMQYICNLIKRNVNFKRIRHLISVNTVDGFQGQERDIILISLVRSNALGQIGFLSDLRRMNVAMTRARMKLIIFGNSKTLYSSKFYRELINYIAKQE